MAAVPSTPPPSRSDVSPARGTPAVGVGANSKPMPILLSELWALITTYVRQETIDPLKGVGRYVLFGTAGALCTGIGVVMLAVGGLRVLQTETDTTFTGNLSWIPYGIVFVVLLAGAAACIAAIQGRNSSPTSSPSSSQAIEGRDR